MPAIDQPARVPVFAPIGRDASAATELLKRAGIHGLVCENLEALLQQLEIGADAVLLAEEALFGKDVRALCAWVDQQPTWSDLPFVILTGAISQPSIIPWRQRLLAALRNVSLLERPVQMITLTSAMLAAVRARSRQYEVRALLEARERTAAQLENLVRARTQQLEHANRELHKEMGERTRAEESLRQAQKIEALGQLTGGVAHDFNNLLMVISGGLDMLGRTTDTARRQMLVDGMRQAAQRGASLTRQLLAFSRRSPLQPQPIDLMRQIGGMKEMLERSLRGDVTVEFEFPENLWPVEVDPGELELVILNLAVNARDAMPTGGTIFVRASNNAGASGDGRDFVGIEIIDSGIGMPPEIMQRVFEPFFTTKEVGKGSGLGLAQVHGFVSQSGGTVEIESTVGHGTTFTIMLPRSDKVPTGELHVAQELTSECVRSAARVLLVEDNDEVAALVREMLDELGFEVLRVASARAALGALANGRRVDLVFSDIVMPGDMNGLDLARETRARRLDIPVLLTSGYAEQAIHDAEAEGLTVLRKPYSLSDLSAALDGALPRSRDMRPAPGTGHGSSRQH
jgi:signal transduction histidine kinase/ActR/RegA family two-component response regulator